MEPGIHQYGTRNPPIFMLGSETALVNIQLKSMGASKISVAGNAFLSHIRDALTYEVEQWLPEDGGAGMWRWVGEKNDKGTRENC